MIWDYHVASDGSEHPGNKQHCQRPSCSPPKLVAPGDFPEMTLGEALDRHKRDCGKCQDAIKATPARFGQRGKMCSEWFEIIQEFADWERDINAQPRSDGGLHMVSREQYIDERYSS